MFGSLTRFAWLFLITLVTIIYRSAGEPSQKIVCSQPDTFTVQISDIEYFIHDTEILIRYDPHVGIFSYPEIKPVNVVYNETIIEFKGYMSPEYPVNQTDLSKKLSWRANGIVFGIGTLQKLSNQNYAVQECRLFLQADIKVSTDLPKAVEESIIYYSQSCAKERLCQHIGILNEEEIQNINKYDEFGNNIARVIRLNVPRIDLNMNVPVDIILKKAISLIKRIGKSTIKIPDITETYNLGLVKAHFETMNGTFEDLSTLKRTEDAIMSNIGRTHVIQAGFGLSIAKFNYDHYKLKVGLIPVSGKISGSVDGLAIGTKMVIDYDKTCGVNLEYINVTEFGKINLKMTGLGPLNSLTSSVLTWLTGMWQEKIVKVIEVNVRNIAEELLSKIICKNYSKSIIDENISLHNNIE